MKTTACFLVLAFVLVTTPTALSDIINQSPDSDGNIKSHFVNSSLSGAQTMQAGVLVDGRSALDDGGDPYDEDRCCKPPTAGNYGWGAEASTYRTILFWDFGPDPAGLDLTGHTATGDATLTMHIFEWYANADTVLEVYAIPPKFAAWRMQEDDEGNHTEGKNQTIYDSGAFGGNDCRNAPFPFCPEGTTWNNFGNDPNRINGPGVDSDEGNTCDGVGSNDTCNGHENMNTIFMENDPIDTIDLTIALGPAVAAKKEIPFEQVLPPNHKTSWNNHRDSPPITITVPQETVQSWIDSPDDNGGLLLVIDKKDNSIPGTVDDRALVTVAGDANNDEKTTGADLIAVQQGFGNAEDIPSGKLAGDANDDGLVTGADLITVQQEFGNTELTLPLIGAREDSTRRPGGLGVGNNRLEFWTSDTLASQSSAWPRIAFETTTPGTAPVPEPAAFALVGLGGLLLSGRRR